MAAPLSNTQIESFRQSGYLHLPAQVAKATCEQMRLTAEAHLAAAIAPVEYEADVGYEGAPASRDSVGGRTIRRLRGAWHRDPVYKTWASDPQLVAMLVQLLGEPPCITLAHHNCIMTKHPNFGTATGWHRDIRYWSFPRNELISVWLALGPEDQANGALHFIPGSHLLEMTPGQMDELDFLRPDVPENQPLFAQGISLPLQAGDVVLFHSGLFHAASRNNSQTVKSSVVFAYHGKSNPPVPGTRSAQSEDLPLA